MRRVSGLPEIDGLLVVPAGCSPWKRRESYLPTALRLTLLQAVVHRLPGVWLWLGEMRRGGASYSVETLRVLQGKLPGVQWHWVLGQDALKGFPQWRGCEELADAVKLMVVRRRGCSEEALQQSLQRLRAWRPQLEVRVLEGYPPQVSGEGIRQCWKQAGRMPAGWSSGLPNGLPNGLPSDVRRRMIGYGRRRRGS